MRTFKKEIKNVKQNQSELKNTITEMKNTTEGINSRCRRMDQPPGRQGSGNHPIRTPKRKKEFLKMRIV